MPKNYDRDSVARALDVHMGWGAVRSWVMTGEPGKTRFTVELVDSPRDLPELSLREAHILCYGLAAARKSALKSLEA